MEWVRHEADSDSRAVHERHSTAERCLPVCVPIKDVADLMNGR